jgi:hypothetical protein
MQGMPGSQQIVSHPQGIKGPCHSCGQEDIVADQHLVETVCGSIFQ